MARISSDADEMIIGINVTPLVDVVLVLLIIFMITAPVIYQSAIKVDLPQASSGEKTEHITLRLTLRKDGSIAVGNEIVNMDKVPALIKEALAQDPAANAVVAADKSLSYGTVIEFIDKLKTSGLQKFAIAVESKK